MRLGYGPALRGWGFDMKRLRQSESRRGGGAFPSWPCHAQISKSLPTTSKKDTGLKEDEWCHYGGLPSPKAYMD